MDPFEGEARRLIYRDRAAVRRLLSVRQNICSSQSSRLSPIEYERFRRRTILGMQTDILEPAAYAQRVIPYRPEGEPVDGMWAELDGGRIRLIAPLPPVKKSAASDGEYCDRLFKGAVYAIQTAEGFGSYEFGKFAEKTVELDFVRGSADARTAPDPDNYEYAPLVKGAVSFLPNTDQPLSCDVYIRGELRDDIPAGTYVTVVPGRISAASTCVQHGGEIQRIRREYGDIDRRDLCGEYTVQAMRTDAEYAGKLMRTDDELALMLRRGMDISDPYEYASALAMLDGKLKERRHIIAQWHRLSAAYPAFMDPAFAYAPGAARTRFHAVDRRCEGTEVVVKGGVVYARTPMVWSTVRRFPYGVTGRTYPSEYAPIFSDVLSEMLDGYALWERFQRKNLRFIFVYDTAEKAVAGNSQMAVKQLQDALTKPTMRGDTAGNCSVLYSAEVCGGLKPGVYMAMTDSDAAHLSNADALRVWRSEGAAPRIKGGTGRGAE